MSRAAIHQLIVFAAASTIVASCFVSFEDYPVEQPSAGSGGVGGSTDASSGASSGIGGSSAASGSGGGPGAGGSAGATGGGAGALMDAAPDQGSPTCLSKGFWSEPSTPKALAFKLVYTNVVPLACIDWNVTCTGTQPDWTSAVEAPDTCPPGNNCWATAVTNCGAGPATVEFLIDKDVDGTGDCNTAFPGSPGKVFATCSFQVEP